MTITGVFAKSKKSSHHVSLTDKLGTSIGIIVTNSKGEPEVTALNSSPVDRTAMKTTSGNSKYSDFEPPYSPIVQDDWSGGRGQYEFELDVTKFSDSYRLTTRRSNRVFLGPQETYSSGNTLRTKDSVMPGAITYTPLISGNRYIARKFTASASYTTGSVWIKVAKRGTPNGALTVNILNDNAGAPDTVRAGTTLAVATVTDTLGEWRLFAIASALTSGTAYWVEVIGAASDDATNHWRIATDTSSVTNTSVSAAGVTWAAAANALYFQVSDANTSMNGKFINLHGALLFIDRPASGASKVWVNGDWGAADSNSGKLNKVVDATKSWTTDMFAGAVVTIAAGKGTSEPTPYRTILSNSATELTVDTAWNIQHDTTTVYTISGTNVWTLLTVSALTKPVTDAAYVGYSTLYLMQGRDNKAVRLHVYNNSGTWTVESKEDSNTLGDYVVLINNVVWHAAYVDSVFDTQLLYCTAVAYSSDYTWTGGIYTGSSSGSKVTGLVPYLDDNGNDSLWVMKEDEVGFLKLVGSTFFYFPLRLSEMRTVRSPKNGVAYAVQNTYIYWSLMNGLEQYYRPTLDDIGPNLGEGLPIDRQGNITQLMGYPGRLYACIDAGDTGYSSILSYTGGGWHEEYRAPLGQRIMAMGFQVTPGVIVDQLWFTQGKDLVYLCSPSETTNPLFDTNYRYTNEGAIDLSAMTAGMGDAQKFVKSIKVESERLSGTAQYIELDYRLDGATAWTPLTTQINTSPVQEIDLTSLYGLSGKKLQFRLRFYTTSNTTTPILRVFLVEALTRVSNKFAYYIPFTFSDNQLDLQGAPDDIKDPQTKLDQINLWATSGMVLMRCVDPLFDNKLVFCLPLPSKAIIASEDNGKRSYYGQLTLQDA